MMELALVKLHTRRYRVQNAALYCKQTSPVIIFGTCSENCCLKTIFGEKIQGCT